MNTTPNALIVDDNDEICQGDVFENVQFTFLDLDSDDETNVGLMQLEFPHAIVISQACDVTAMSGLEQKREGPYTKFMTSILMCPIFEKDSFKVGEHLGATFAALGLEQSGDSIICYGDDLKISKKDWHYRYHDFNAILNDRIILENNIIDFKQYFSVPIRYLIKNRNNRKFRLDPIFATKITLKFCSFLSRVAIP